MIRDRHRLLPPRTNKQREFWSNSSQGTSLSKHEEWGQSQPRSTRSYCFLPSWFNAAHFRIYLFAFCSFLCTVPTIPILKTAGLRLPCVFLFVMLILCLFGCVFLLIDARWNRRACIYGDIGRIADENTGDVQSGRNEPLDTRCAWICVHCDQRVTTTTAFMCTHIHKVSWD